MKSCRSVKHVVHKIFMEGSLGENLLQGWAVVAALRSTGWRRGHNRAPGDIDRRQWHTEGDEGEVRENKEKRI